MISVAEMTAADKCLFAAKEAGKGSDLYQFGSNKNFYARFIS
jgi:hypothetical protein